MKINDIECKIVEELIPIYIENLTDPSVGKFINAHLEQCEECKEVYMKMKSDIHINSTKEEPKYNKKILRYINSIKIWYLLCPLVAFLLYRLELLSILKLYEGGLLLFSVACILSEIYHKGTWWDQECVDLQDESREDAKRKWGAFYIRPFLFAIPSLLILLILEGEQMIFFIGDYLRGIM
ncbi:MAG: zf-HC2 domain-containing protein [Clostridiales bacterium]|nr:zf-HC2 domain-containing protein [Clostridiales bacterium]